MKKLKVCLAMLVFGAFAMNVSAGNYKIDEKAIETTIENAEDVTISSFESLDEMGLSSLDATSVKAGGDSKAVFLIAAFFCGQFGIHRYYAGVDGLKYCGFYFCTGGIVAQVDFASVLFGGTEVGDYSADEFVVW